MVDFYYIERLADMAGIEVDWGRLDYINENWNEFTESEYYNLVNKLRENEQDPVTSGMNYNQTDILKHLKKLK